MSTVPANIDADLDRVFKFDEDISAQHAEDVNTNDEQQSGGDEQSQSVQGADDQANPQASEQEQDELKDFMPAMGEKPQRDAKGNIIDKDGKVIAGTRQEKRDLFMYNKLRVAADGLRRERDEARGKLQQVQALLDMPKRLGLNMEQVQEAVTFRAQLEANPIATVREIIAKVVASGYTMEQLFGPDAPAAINASIVQQQIDKHLAPIRQKHDAQEREQQIARDAEQDFRNFVEAHEYADVHGNEIAAIVQRDGVAPEVAYYQLEAAAAKHGLDFSKPLIPQLQAKQGGGRQVQQNGREQQHTQQHRHLPGARSAVGAPAVQTQRNGLNITPQTSFKDIVADAFKTVAASRNNAH